jgi:hypothetical protein
MPALSDYPLAELKLIYQLLHRHLPDTPELMDSQLLQDLQHHLQQQATQEGIDVSHHGQWAAWLNGMSA